MQETLVWFLGGEDPLEKGTATHSSILPGEFHGVAKRQAQLRHFHSTSLHRDTKILPSLRLEYWVSFLYFTYYFLLTSNCIKSEGHYFSQLSSIRGKWLTSSKEKKHRNYQTQGRIKTPQEVTSKWEKSKQARNPKGWNLRRLYCLGSFSSPWLCQPLLPSPNNISWEPTYPWLISATVRTVTKCEGGREELSLASY